MEIRASGSAASRRAPADYFTGAVWQDPVVEAPSPGNVRASLVHFEPGARTAWHTHPAGQTLYILSGVGRVQSAGGPVREVRAGDVIWFSPGEIDPAATIDDHAVDDLAAEPIGGVAWAASAIDHDAPGAVIFAGRANIRRLSERRRGDGGRKEDGAGSVSNHFRPLSSSAASTRLNR